MKNCWHCNADRETTLLSLHCPTSPVMCTISWVDARDRLSGLDLRDTWLVVRCSILSRFGLCVEFWEITDCVILVVTMWSFRTLAVARLNTSALELLESTNAEREGMVEWQARETYALRICSSLPEKRKILIVKGSNGSGLYLLASPLLCFDYAKFPRTLFSVFFR